jgi:6-phosphogluconolactonase
MREPQPTGPSREECSVSTPSRPATTGRVYVGCSTDASTPGIHVFDLDVDGHIPVLTPRHRLDGIDRPSYLAGHPSRPVIYAVGETDDGEVVELHLDLADGSLRLGRRVPSHGDAPCHVDTDGRLLSVANYASGSAAVYSLRADGRIDQLVWTVRHEGGGPNARQDASHAHCATLDPRRASVHVVDLGTDRIVRYDLDSSSGTFRKAHELALAPGSGPRHLAFHPSEPIAYLVGELDCTVAVLVAPVGTGDLRVVDVVPTVPDGARGSLAAAVRVHPGGHRVYVSNRGDDSIATFATDRRAEPLVALGHVPSGGRAPRDLAVDPSGRVLLAANQGSGRITGFAIDEAGIPREIGTLAEVAEPACILIMEFPHGEVDR